VLRTAALLADLEGRAFRGAGAGAPPRIGAEVELIPVASGGGPQVPIAAEAGPATLPLLRAHGARHGWTEAPTAYGAPQWTVPGGGRVSY
jgi:hypothetical protein